MEKSTKYRNVKTPAWWVIILVYVIYAFLLIGLGYGIYKVYTNPITDTGFIQSMGQKILVILVMTFMFCFLLFPPLGHLFGFLKGKKKVRKDNQKVVKENPYIYFRELPNDFGIGVTSLLFDSKIENYKDIIAVILDLCGKKYLSLVKENENYMIKVLNPGDDKLLSNEKYILDLIVRGEIKNVDYKTWYNLCLEDGQKLNVYYHAVRKTNFNEPLAKDKQLKKLQKIQLIISIIIGTFVASIFIFTKEYIQGILYGVLFFVISFVALILPFYIIFLIMVITNASKQEKDMGYELELDNHLVRTLKGVEEMQKLISFRDFLADFGSFTDKHAEEIVLWDRYLSYAQVFGLTNEIMKTGYKEIIDNGSFTIDDINNITIDNIILNK